LADIRFTDQVVIERYLGMSGGYVLDFGDRTFGAFVSATVGIEINCEKYYTRGTSKANRVRSFLEQESPHLVAKLLEGFVEYKSQVLNIVDSDTTKVLDIANGLRSAHGIDLDKLVPNAPGKEFDSLAQSAKECIERGEPEVGLDRLHTFLTKYIRNLCETHGIATGTKPLNSLYGEYMRWLKDNDKLESNMTLAILRACNLTLEKFNDVRNNQSLAHDNVILNKTEAYFIASHVIALVSFLNAIEINAKPKEEEAKKDIQKNYECEIPF